MIVIRGFSTKWLLVIYAVLIAFPAAAQVPEGYSSWSNYLAELEHALSHYQNSADYAASLAPERTGQDRQALLDDANLNQRLFDQTCREFNRALKQAPPDVSRDFGNNIEGGLLKCYIAR